MKRITLAAFRARPAARPGEGLNSFSRHYQTDEALTNFTKKTGIKVNRIEANEDALLEPQEQGRAQPPTCS
jgi:iron(III) transport system substrate-binding protein